MRAGRWLIFSKAIDIDVPPAANALIYVAGFSMTTTPGKVGETLRLWLLKTGFDARYDRTATVLIADRLGDAAALCILLVLSAAWLGTYAYSSASVHAPGLCAACSRWIIRRHRPRCTPVCAREACDQAIADHGQPIGFRFGLTYWRIRLDVRRV
jgi:hypothetical protein